MTREQVLRWSKTKVWDPKYRVRDAAELQHAMDHSLGMLVCITPASYAECRGPSDPHCGRCRFSVHGCNGAPSRAEYLDAVNV